MSPTPEMIRTSTPSRPRRAPLHRLLIGALMLALTASLALLTVAPASADDDEGRITGRVTGNGQGLKDALAHADYCSSPAGGGCAEWKQWISIRTDADGYYSLLISTGTYRVRFTYPGATTLYYDGNDGTTSIEDALDVVVTDGGTTSGINGDLVLSVDNTAACKQAQGKLTAADKQVKAATGQVTGAQKALGVAKTSADKLATKLTKAKKKAKSAKKKAKTKAKAKVKTLKSQVNKANAAVTTAKKNLDKAQAAKNDALAAQATAKKAVGDAC